MAKCDFDIAFNDSAEDLVQKAGNAIRGAGGQLKGDVGSGEFELPTPLGSIRGNYSLQPGAIHITVNAKPMLLNCGRIEEELRKYLSK